MTLGLSNGFIAPCIPTRAPKPPAGSDWVHEIKYDGYRIIVRRDGDTVRLFTRRGYDWSGRYRAIARAAARLRARSFTVDGEAAVCDGIAVFHALHRLSARQCCSPSIYWMRRLPLGERKTRSLWIQRNQCRHTTVMNFDHLPGDLTVPAFGPRMVCTKCGTIGADARPNWQERSK
jgi:hypothetical protein